VNQNNTHWTLIVIDVKDKVIQGYDSLGREYSHALKLMVGLVNN
jgi:Ulp1 family protease